jgi:DNA-binding MurR/RpiR family transcriptional regulator
MRDDECLAAIKEFLVPIVDKVLREQYTEIRALSVLVAACKNAHPAEAALLDQLLETARNSEDIKKVVDVKIESILKMLRSLDLSNLEQVSQALMRSDAQSKVVN